MSTRSSDTRLDILPETPGSQHQSITGTRLPTYNQVLLCYLAHLEKLRREDVTNNVKLTQLTSNIVVGQVVVLVHYKKSSYYNPYTKEDG